MPDTVDLSMDDLRAVTTYAANSAAAVLAIYEQHHPSDVRPREAIIAALAFADGGKRGKALRDVSWAALRAAQQATHPSAEQAARAAMAASGAAYLHPLPNATQVRHILGAAAHAIRAAELDAPDQPDIAQAHLAAAVDRATPAMLAVLLRYPPAPSGGGRVGELLRLLDAALRQVAS